MDIYDLANTIARDALNRALDKNAFAAGMNELVAICTENPAQAAQALIGLSLKLNELKRTIERPNARIVPPRANLKPAG
jgi:hypothetical protein